MKNKILKMVVLILMGPIAANAGLIEKAPDLGPWWSPLNSDGGSYIYANSFVADESGRIDSLGFWAWADAGQSSGQVILEVYEAGPTPDSSSVVARTAVIDLLLTDSLQFYQATTLFSDAITAGGQYWFAANVIGLPTNGDFGIGGHTQNSGGIIDDGTFWYSNDPDGVIFDGENVTPEMAFRVNINAAQVPEPSTLALGGIMLLAAGSHGDENIVNIPAVLSEDLLNKRIVLMACNDLTKNIWEEVGTYSITNRTTVLCTTNALPARFYKAKIKGSVNSALGSVMLLAAVSRGENIVTIPAVVSDDLLNKSIVLMTCTDLSQNVWEEVGTYSITNRTTVLSETNALPARFYKAKIKVNDGNP